MRETICFVWCSFNFTLAKSNGVSASGTSTFNSDLVVTGGITLATDLEFSGSDSARIFQNGQEIIYLDNANGVVRIPIYSLGINQIFAHNNDNDTRIQFNTNQIQSRFI